MNWRIYKVSTFDDGDFQLTFWMSSIGGINILARFIGGNDDGLAWFASSYAMRVVMSWGLMMTRLRRHTKIMVGVVLGQTLQERLLSRKVV